MQNSKGKVKGFTTAPLVLGGAELAVLFLPVVFLTVPLLRLTDSELLSGLTGWSPPIVAAALSSIVTFDRSARQAMLKWILSLPFSAVFWLYFVNSSFLIRLYNYVDPTFGDGWAGDGMGIMLVLGAALFAGGIGVAVGMYLSQRPPTAKIRKRILLMQKTVIPIVCGIIFITVIILGIIMPDYTPLAG